ncbi:MAG: DnaJ domain-containing protein [Pseudolabrys sp.]
MPTIILGVLVLVLALWALKVVSKVDPKIAARVTKASGGLISLGLAVFLGLRGEMVVALPLGAFGLGLLGWLPFGVSGFGPSAQKSSGQTSQVRSAYFEMQLDHDTGAMRGRVLAGKHQGAALERLDVKTLIEMLADIDEDSRALLMAYLDRRDAGWREHAQGDAATGRSTASAGKMSEQEAYEFLGLQPGAKADAIVSAHRRLMKKFHPDQDGSTYIAARINEAKEVLLRRHR